MSNYSRFIDDAINSAPSQVVGNIDANPDEAARALDLEKASGTPASTIYADLDGFEEQHQSEIAGHIVKSNPQLRAYIDSHPLAAPLSNGDYGNLDEASQKATVLTRAISQASPFGLFAMALPEAAREGWHKMMENFAEPTPAAFGFGPLGIGALGLLTPRNTPLKDEDIKNYPLASSVIQAGYVPFNILSAVLAGVAGFTYGGAKETYHILTGDEAGAKRFARDIAGAVEMQLTGFGVHAVAPPANIKFSPKHIEALRASMPWLENGLEPPRGLHPEIDKLKVERNKVELDALDEALKKSTASATRERSSDMYANFMRQHFGNGKIGIAGERVVELYGDKVPHAEDNLLGWVPGIKEQLEAARETGQDVQVPIADWLARVEPDLAKELHDDVRVRPGNITKAEAENPLEVTHIESPLAQVRGASGLEPMFSIGDRKLTLERLDTPELQAIKQKLQMEDFHDFEFKDENGRSVGTINLSSQKGGKQLYIEMINGINGLGPRDFGPSLMRDILRQLKEQFPEAESITGHRVSGAREKAGTFDRPSAQPVVKLDDISNTDVRALQAHLEDVYWEQFSQTLQGALKPTELYTKNEAALTEAVNKELARIVPKKVDVQEVADIDLEGAKRKPAGAYVQYTDKNPTIIWSLASPDTLGVARHEAIHHLRQNGFFTEAEWKTLTKAAEEQGWINEKIERGYGSEKPDVKVEEAVAEAFRDWAKGKDTFSAKAKEAVGLASPIERIFRKLQDFLDAIGKKFKEILGHEPTWEELFESAFKGEIGQREGGKPLNPEAFRLSVEDRADMLRANATGLDLKSFQRLQKLIEQRHREDYDVALARAQREQTKRQSEEWKAKAAELRPQVVEDIRARPDVAADEFLRSGELFGKKLDKPVKLLESDIRALERPDTAAIKIGDKVYTGHSHTDALDRASRENNISQEEFLKQLEGQDNIGLDGFKTTEGRFVSREEAYKLQEANELRDKLLRPYIAKSGAPIDEVANLFGFHTGEDMVQRLAALNEQRAASKKNPDLFRRQLIDDELNRRMEREHGFLEKNILEEAQDQALSKTQLDILAEEYHAAGMMAKVGTVDKNVAQAWAKDAFNKLTVGDVSSDHFMAQIGKYGREAERALIAGKSAEAVQFMQKKFLNALMAKEAKALEAEITRFDRNAKRYSAREIKSMEPEYLNFIHQILVQVGKPVKRSIQDLAENIAAGSHETLEKFVDAKSGMLRELPVPDFLYDPAFRKPTEELSVDQFRAVNDGVKALAHNGRDELKIYRAGEAADFDVKKSEMMEQLEQFKQKHYDTKGNPIGGIPKWAGGKIIRSYLAAHMQLENIMARWDKFDPKGVWSQYVMRDLIEGANQEAAWGKEYAKKFSEFDDGVNVRQTVDNQLFRDPLGGNLLSLNRGNLRSILLNAGNESNLKKLANGYKLQPEVVMNWLHQNATKEDWSWGQKVWDMFAEIKNRSDTMYRSLTGGVAPEGIDIRPIDTPHGQVKGGYYPIIFHPEFEGTSKKLLGGDPLEQPNYIRATTPSRYTKERTGYTAPLALDLDMLPGQIRSMLHDIALRPAVINASKVMYDPQIRAKIAAHYGTEYRDLLTPYLRDVANSANYIAKDQKLFSQTSEFIRQNMISTLVGFNPGTVLKHGPTAWVQSMHEVGSIPFLRELKSLMSVNEATGETNWRFAMETSQELQRRDRNYRETLSGAIEEFQPTNKFMNLRQTVLHYASKPVAMSDIISAVPTWLAKYRQVMEESGVHGDAVFEADRAVRRAHGSTAITNRPSVMRGGTMAQWFASVYGFFNHIMNRQAELVWKAGDTLNLVKEGEYKEAMAKVPALSAMLFAYVLAPALIEELVTPLASKDNESWGKKAAKGIGFTLGASWVGIRDISSALLNDRDPSAGLISTAFKQALNVKRDLSKDRPLSREHAGKLIQDATGAFGTLTGLTPQPLGRAARFGLGVSQGQEHPRGPWGWMVGLRYGTLEKHSPTFEQWMKHH